MINGKNKTGIKENYNNLYDTDEILWLLQGNEELTAYDFVCQHILNIDKKNISEIFESSDDNKYVKQLIQKTN